MTSNKSIYHVYHDSFRLVIQYNYLLLPFNSNLYAALAIFSRSPAAYHAVRSLGILNLPCDRTLKGHMYHSSSPGNNEEGLLERAQQL